jgi:hypothetical protein
MKQFTAVFSTLVLGVGIANAQGLVDFDGTETGLTAYTNDAITGFTGAGLGTDAFEVSVGATTTWGPGDAFFPMSRQYSVPTGTGLPFGISDDSVAAAQGNSVFESDTSGIAGQAKTDGFFGIIDTVNSKNPNDASVATFTFDVTGLSGIVVSADFAAMGDFEGSDDTVLFEYTWDGASYSTLFESSVDEDGSQPYTMDSGTEVIEDDPMLLNGVLLNDEFQGLSAPVSGTGTELTIRLTAELNGGSEAFGFDNLAVVPEPASAIALALAGLFIRRR